MYVCTLMIATVLPVVGAANVQSPDTLASGLIGIKIVAKVYEVTDPHNLLGGVIKVNDTITGKYVYDAGTPDAFPADPSVGKYDMISSSCGFEVGAGGLIFKTNPSDVDFYLLIINDYYAGYPHPDLYVVCSQNNLQLANGMIVDWFQWELKDPNGTVLTNDSLLTTAPVLANWVSIYGLTLYGYDPANPSKEYVVRAHVTKATKNCVIGGYDATISQSQQSLLTEINKCTASHNQDVLWDNGLPNGYYAVSSQYQPTTQTNEEVVADVDVSEPWVVTGGDFRIIINYVGGPAAITGVNVFFYKNQDDNTPAMARYAERTATTFIGTYTGANYFGMSEVLMNVTFAPVVLTSGKWWICFQPVIDWETYWLASNLTGLGCYVSWPDSGYPKWTDDNDLPLIGKDIDVSFRLFGYIQTPQLEIGAITGGFGLKLQIKNMGTVNATNVTVDINFSGAWMILPLLEHYQKTFNLDAGFSENITVIVFGLGKTTIKVDATCTEGSSATKTAEGTVFLFFIFGVK